MRRQRHVHALGDVILDQKAGLADGRAFRIGERPARSSRPSAAPAGSTRSKRASAEALVGQGDALVLDAIRALDDQGQRRGGGDALRSRAAARRDGRFRRSDRRRARHRRKRRAPWAASRPLTPRSVRSKAVLLQIEEIVIGLAVAGDDEARRQSALRRAKGRARNCATPAGVGFDGRQRFVVPGDQPHFDAVLRRRPWRASGPGAVTPSRPLSAVRPRSETTNHCVARRP